MNEIYLKLRTKARQIVANLPVPAFQKDLAQELARSRALLTSDPFLTTIAREIEADLDDDFGHGILHTTLVCVDAGAIVQREQGGPPGRSLPEGLREQMILVQVAGLLHDIRRKQKDHAQKGAEYAAELLKNHALEPDEIDTVCQAIREHEAFVTPDPDQAPVKPSLISDALYDADKFRWGPDNFTHTLWDMVMFARIPIYDFLKKYPGGMDKLAQIRNTFRTDTGKRYGPEMIDLGIETGNRLFAFLKTEYPLLFQNGEN